MKQTLLIIMAIISFTSVKISAAEIIQKSKIEKLFSEESLFFKNERKKFKGTDEDFVSDFNELRNTVLKFNNSEFLNLSKELIKNKKSEESSNYRETDAKRIMLGLFLYNFINEEDISNFFIGNETYELTVFLFCPFYDRESFKSDVVKYRKAQELLANFHQKLYSDTIKSIE